jgi:hypothetical protein
MINRKVFPKLMGDIEKVHETVSEAFGDGPAGEPLTVRLEDSWTDLVRMNGVERDLDAPLRLPSAVPILDNMNGSLQWD